MASQRKSKQDPQNAIAYQASYLGNAIRTQRIFFKGEWYSPVHLI